MKLDLNQVVKGVTLEKVCSIKPFKGATESKQIVLKVKFDRVPLNAVFSKALSAVVIQWQNGPGRKNFENWENGQTVEIDFKAPAREYLSPEEALLRKLANMSAEERKAYKQALLEKLESL